MDNQILMPCLAMVAVTLFVWVKLYIDRVSEMQRNRIDVQALSSAKQTATLLTQTQASDNFKNLFELPNLFYVACIILFITQKTTSCTLTLAWSFVFFRAMHSPIHCTYNKVMHRFVMYLISSLILFGLWICLGLQLI